MIAIGASTGGTEAIKDVLSALPGEMPPIVMVMPEGCKNSWAMAFHSATTLPGSGLLAELGWLK